MNDKSIWTLSNKYQLLGNGSRLQLNDRIDILRAASPQRLTITREGGGREAETILDVELSGSAEALAFARSRGRNHPDSDNFRGEIRWMQVGTREVLVGTLGYKEESPGGQDDDEVEVFIATKTGNA